MKKLKNITNKEEAEYMNRMKSENLVRSLSNENENWFSRKLDSSWSRQVIKGYRIFDFWNHSLGCAIEIDGPEHDRDYDNYRDEYNFRRSGVIVLRVRNKNEEDAVEVLEVLKRIGSLQNRKELLGITGNTKEARRKLSSLPYDKNNLMFIDYFKNIDYIPYWKSGR